MLLLLGCSTIKYVPVKTIEYVTVKETETVRDTLVQFKVEKEYVRDYTGMLDTLDMETSYATAKAWVDTSRNILAGEIKNKEKMVDVPVQVKEKAAVRDSIVYKDVPVPVEVEKVVHPGYEKYLWGLVILSLLALSFWLYTKFHR